MDKRIASGYLTARCAGVCLDEPLTHSPPDAGGRRLPLPGRRPAAPLPLPQHPTGPVSQQLRIDHASCLANPKLYADVTAGRDLFEPYLKAIDQVRKLKSLTPVAGAALPWMLTAAHIHMTSQERGVSYAAAETLAKTRPEAAHLMVPIRHVMDNTGLCRRAPPDADDLRPRPVRQPPAPRLPAPTWPPVASPTDPP